MRSPPLRPSLHLFFLLSLLALVWSPASFPGATAVDVQEVAGLEGDAVGGGPSSSSSSLTLVYFGMPFKIDDLDFSEAAGLTIADVKKRIEAEYAIPATEQVCCPSLLAIFSPARRPGSPPSFHSWLALLSLVVDPFVAYTLKPRT